MKATELRIGNYLHDRKGRLCKVEELVCREGERDVYAPVISGPTTSLPNKPIPLTEEWLLKFGFEEIPHFTVANNLVKDLGNRERHLSFGDLGTPNEMLWLHEGEDIVCLHNYDYNGKMHVHQLQNLYHALTGEELMLINA